MRGCLRAWLCLLSLQHDLKAAAAHTRAPTRADLRLDVLADGYSALTHAAFAAAPDYLLTGGWEGRLNVSVPTARR